MRKTDFLINEIRPDKGNIDVQILPLLNDFETAFAYHSQLSQYSASPLISLQNLADKLNIGSIRVKNEALRFGVPAIKLLGASYAMHRILMTDTQIKTFCTATDGNHGRAVAWAAKQLDKEAIVFVPDYTVESRIANIEAEDAQVVKVTGDYDGTVDQAKQYARENNCQLVQDTSWEGYQQIPALITSGYYTQMQEIRKQTNKSVNSIDLIILQTGVGSWPSAVAHFIRNNPGFKNTKIVCVEPYESDCFLESAKCNKRSRTNKTQVTKMAGLNCGTPSLIAWELLSSETDAFLSIEDGYSMEAMRLFNFPLKGDPKIEAGESGAAGLAALLAIIENESLSELRKFLQIDLNTRVLLFNTEGITDPELFKQIIG